MTLNMAKRLGHSDLKTSSVYMDAVGQEDQFAGQIPGCAWLISTLPKMKPTR